MDFERSDHGLLEVLSGRVPAVTEKRHEYPIRIAGALAKVETEQSVLYRKLKSDC
jgi:hypothetical protein